MSKPKLQKKDTNSDAIGTDPNSSHDMADILRPKKKAKKQDLSTITLGYLHSKGKSMKVKHMKRIRILFDTGCGATLINHSMGTKLKQRQVKPCNWNTKGWKLPDQQNL